MGHEPVVFDNRTDFSLLRDVSDSFAFVKGDATSLEQLVQSMRVPPHRAHLPSGGRVP